ncbi:carbohydrate binding family 9 domain-containing protein, partial [candidate division KSB1 bacterium]|nr:carbohydrate binding family 9 domain-containing protein [candidate division KSB1 bacterium]
MNFLRSTLVLSLLLLLFSNPANAIEPLRPFRTNTPPSIDGLLDDPVWQQAPFETGFITYHPDYGSPMSEDTKVWYAYDRENLYFAYKCYDSEPGKIKTSVAARDKIRPDDWICINLDTFNDQQSLYALYVNPAGIQMDSRATLTDEDMSIDVVWYSAGKIDNEGYSIELKIPFKSIRFSHKEPVEMGVIFERYISRKSEAGTYPALDPKWGQNFLTQTRPLIYENVKHYRLVELLPALTYANNRAIDQGKLKSEKNKGEVSLTGKYGITSHLVLDGTVNPDFSQVEADAGQVEFNQRCALYYPEKRPFFLEGRENFIFGGSTAGDPLGSVVYTRTIVDPLVGIKLTGKIGDNNSLASIYALDELSDDQQQGDYAHVGILRYKRALSQDGFIGGFYTGRELQDSYNRVIGSDGQIRLNRSSHVGFHGFYSQNKFQSEKNDGYALGLNYYYQTRDWFINARLHDLSQDFNTDIGYVTRTGITRTRVGVIRRLYPTSRFFMRIDPLLNNQFIRDKASQQWENNNAFYLTFLLPRSSSIRVGYAFATEIFNDE